MPETRLVSRGSSGSGATANSFMAGMMGRPIFRFKARDAMFAPGRTGRLCHGRCEDPLRRGFRRLVEDSPSLRRDVARLISAETDRSIKIAIADLEEHGELDPATLARIRATTYTEEQILGDWFPPDA